MKTREAKRRLARREGSEGRVHVSHRLTPIQRGHMQHTNPACSPGNTYLYSESLRREGAVDPQLRAVAVSVSLCVLQWCVSDTETMIRRDEVWSGTLHLTTRVAEMGVTV